MNLKVQITKVFLLGALLFPSCFWGQREVTTLLQQLDHTVADYPNAITKKEKRLQYLKDELRYSTSNEQRYAIYVQLHSEYTSFQLDSALTYARKSWQVALALNDLEKVNGAQLNVAMILGTSGMYKESIDLLESIPVNTTPSIKGYYFGTYRIVYGYLTEYAASALEKQKYKALTQRYRDSSMLYFQPKSREFCIANTDVLFEKKLYNQAIAALLRFYTSTSAQDPDQAVLAYLIAEGYRLKKDKEQQKKWLILSAISDVQLAKKENISLRKIAFILYEEGDIDRAYTYIKRSLEDALFCNAKLRTYEISKMLPIINQAYENKNETNRTQLTIFLLAVSILSLILLGALVLLFKQMRKVAAAQKALTLANEQLSNLNQDLKEINQRLNDTNATLAEASLLKEIYIGRYMDQCSDYIGKLEEYSQKLKVMATAGKVNELLKLVKSNAPVENELREFYTQFDQTFLELFPSFIQDFSNLLVDTDTIQLKKGELLNTELRIFALIRLGIKDSAKIAVFLRYSVSTIYNYRSQLKNKARGPREEFENQVLLIGTAQEK